MKRRNLLLTAAAAVVGSCARMEKRHPRYDPHKCPFCDGKGECFYCGGTGKCSFCNGTGTRTTEAPAIPEKGISKSSYEEECPYCKGDGVCGYCEGETTCWVCEGDGRIDHWEFYQKYKEGEKNKSDAKTNNKESAGKTRSKKQQG